MTSVAESDCLRAIENKEGLVSWWLLASYAYYVKRKPLITDQLFDRINTELIEHWDDVEHIHKKLISEDDLRAYSAFSLKDYPKVVKVVFNEYGVRDVT